MTARDPILSGPPTAAALSGASSSRPDALIVPADWCLSIQGEAGGRQSGERKPSLPPRSSLFSVLKSLERGGAATPVAAAPLDSRERDLSREPDLGREYGARHRTSERPRGALERAHTGCANDIVRQRAAIRVP